MEISVNPKFSLRKKPVRHFFSDLSLWALIVSNLIVIFWALIEGWALAVIMWVYWSQSVSIGILWFFKILTLKEFSTKGFKINNQSVEPTTSTKIQTAIFFLVHYGFFHVGYAVFLSALFKHVRLMPICVMAAVFFVYQSFSFFYNKKWEEKRKPNIGKMMFFPYARIIPMHLTIIFGGQLADGNYMGNAALAFFMLLKTLADVIMHMVERRGFSDKPVKEENQNASRS
ncbi:DUF6498-containing protein [Planctomycetota bacterium]